MNVSLSAINRWVKSSARHGAPGENAPGAASTPEQTELREMRKRIQRLEMENEILKKGYCRFNLSMQHPFSIISFGVLNFSVFLGLLFS